MTRTEAEQLVLTLRLLRAGELKYSTAISMLLNMIETAEREQAAQDMVDASLEQSSKGADHGDKRSF